jgi:uncharacterized protein
MEFLAGYIASVFIGLSLGLVGGGGSLFTVPVLVYLFHIEPTLATAYSLFIVGITSAVGSVRFAIERKVDFNTALIFGTPSLAGVLVARSVIIPLIPETTHYLDFFIFSRESMIMLLFAGLMLIGGVGMIRAPRQSTRVGKRPFPVWRIAAEGTGVGLITGLVGAGGGFLIVPALVLLAGLPMERAVGTSLAIVAARSLLGFAADVSSGQLINFGFIGLVALLAIFGVLTGSYLSRRMDGEKLKSAFGWAIVSMSVYIFRVEMWH